MKVTIINEMLTEKTPYRELIRPYGSGDMRLGRHVDIGEDIFSFAFCAMVEDKLMDTIFNVEKGVYRADEEQEKRVAGNLAKELAKPKTPRGGFFRNVQNLKMTNISVPKMPFYGINEETPNPEEEEANEVQKDMATNLI